jgi:NAD-dependent SIR2 family protein deacetylase
MAKMKSMVQIGRGIEPDIERAAAALREAEALLITAGAGMGVDSGLPDFRGTEGFWKAYPVIAKLGLSFAEMANPDWFKSSPELAWAFYGHRLNLYRATTPHAGFQQLLDAGARKPHGYFVFTSNVDGQFQKAGFSPERIVECHGSIHHFQCCKPCGDDIWDAASEVVAINEDLFKALPPLPVCPRCRMLARPNVLMFGDWSWHQGRTQAQEIRLQNWLSSLKQGRARVAVVEIGAGTAIPSVRLRSQAVANDLEATLIRINPREAETPAGGLGLRMNAAEGIQRICEKLEG